MTQPKFVPIAEADQVRRSYRLEASAAPPLASRRPGEVRFPARTGGRGRGAPGPDQGFALRLARRFANRLLLGESESTEDVLTGCALLASRRAGRYGRAPCVYDLEVVFELFGFLGPVEPHIVADRAARFRGVAHDYATLRRLVDSVPEDLLLVTADEAIARPPELQELLEPRAELDAEADLEAPASDWAARGRAAASTGA